jgi:hypothetical protein
MFKFIGRCDMVTAEEEKCSVIRKEALRKSAGPSDRKEVSKPQKPKNNSKVINSMRLLYHCFVLLALLLVARGVFLRFQLAPRDGVNC